MNFEKLIKECDELYEKEDYKELINTCDEILAQFPYNPKAMSFKGLSLHVLGENEEALKILEKGVEINPDNYYMKNNLAMVYYDMGDYETSLKLCEEGLKIKDFDWLCINKFKNLVRLERYDEAIDYKNALGDDLSVGLIFTEDNMPEEELNYYRHVLERDPEDIQALERVETLSKN